MQLVTDTQFRAEVTLGIGPVRGRYTAEITLSELDEPRSVTLSGSVDGALGFGRGQGRLRLEPVDGGRTVLHYEYEAALGGRVVSIAGRLLDGALRVVIEQFVEALAAQAGGETRVISGGQSLVPMLNMRLARPALLVDIMHVAALGTVVHDGQRLVIGAGVRQRAMEARPDLVHRQPLLAMVLPWLGHMQTRSRGTVCGSVAHADPSAELPLALVALVALEDEVHLRTHRKARRVPAGSFLTGMMATARADDELIEAISVPTVRPGTGYAFGEVSRRHGDSSSPRSRP